MTTQTEEKDLTNTSEDISSEDTVEEAIREANEKKKAKRQVVISRKPASMMNDFVEDVPTPPEEGDLIEGVVIGQSKTAVYLDVPPFGTGIIYGREYMSARDLIKKIGVGDTVSAKVVEAENENGYIELSLKEARQAALWTEAEDLMRSKTTIELPVKDANKGGLLVEWQGIVGFLPASQLKPTHYPRVEDGDKDRILEELRKLVGTKLGVIILSANPKEGKLIFSEKDIEEPVKKDIAGKYAVGDVLEGEITGIVDFGAFVRIEDGLEGLVHISEIDWGLVEDPRTMFTPGDKVRVKIIEINDGKISLSIKALKDNPWLEAAKKFKKGNEVNAVVIKFNKYGALASIEEGVAGLVHVSEFGTEEKLREALELGKAYTFKITLFNPNEQKMTLSPNKKK